MKTKQDRCRGKLELDTLDQLNSIANDVMDARGLLLILNQYFDETRRSQQERLYEYYGVLNEQVIQCLLDLANELKDVVSEIEVKR